LRVDSLINPFFIVEGNNRKIKIDPMPGIFQMSIDQALYEIDKSANKGIKAILLFGIPDNKDSYASAATDENGVIQNAIREIKKRYPELIVIADTCLCEYMDHGHCGIVEKNKIVNDPSVSLLARSALAQAQAGADMVAPSDMMDGTVGAIRQSLDAAGFTDTAIMAYSAKFSSALYGPFRVAAQSAPQFGNRKTYQMDPANGLEALREIELDIKAGADIVMVKPALAYLDIISQARQMTKLPIAAYNVSGEYAMVKAAAAQGWIDEKRVVLETLTGIIRAGANLIITYHANDVSDWLKTDIS
jgi:porphobilinogen synthase